MEEIQTIINIYLPFILAGLVAMVLLLFVLCIILFCKVSRERKRYDVFMGTNRRPNLNLETKLDDYFKTVTDVEEKYTKLLNMVTDIDATMSQNIQKVGFVRYNPFEEMGGNLCFAVALLDKDDNGIVLNGIHSRTGSFTYAKPIELGVSTYILSVEEKQAIELAKENAHKPKYEKVVKAKRKPIFRRKKKEETEELPEVGPQKPIVLPQEEVVNEVEDVNTTDNIDGVYRPVITGSKLGRTLKKESVGDVTIDEEKQILTEEANAQKIINAQSDEERERVKRETRKVEVTVNQAPVIKINVIKQAGNNEISENNITEKEEIKETKKAKKTRKSKKNKKEELFAMDTETVGNIKEENVIRLEQSAEIQNKEESVEETFIEETKEKKAAVGETMMQVEPIVVPDLEEKLAQISVQEVTHQPFTSLLNDFDIEKAATKYKEDSNALQGIVNNSEDNAPMMVMETGPLLEEDWHNYELEDEQKEQKFVAEEEMEQTVAADDIVQETVNAELKSQPEEVSIEESIGPRERKRKLLVDDLVDDANWENYLGNNHELQEEFGRLKVQTGPIIRQRKSEELQGNVNDVTTQEDYTVSVGETSALMEQEEEINTDLLSMAQEEETEPTYEYQQENLELESLTEQVGTTNLAEPYEDEEQGTTDLYEYDDELPVPMIIYEYEEEEQAEPELEYEYNEYDLDTDSFYHYDDLDEEEVSTEEINTDISEEVKAGIERTEIETTEIETTEIEETEIEETDLLAEISVEDDTISETEELSDWEIFRRNRLLRMSQRTDDDQ